MKYIETERKLLQLLTPEQAWKFGVIPSIDNGSSVTYFIGENAEIDQIRDDLELLSGKGAEFETTDHELIKNTLKKYYYRDEKKNKEKFRIADNSDDGFIKDLVLEAISLKSSDIHIEPYEGRCRIRFRVDGKLVERYIIETADFPYLLNKIKIFSNLDIAEKRLPQDGRIGIKLAKGKRDLRVSTLPTLHGEKIVLRILSDDVSNIDLGTLGLNPSEEGHYLKAAGKPNGLILISGPTGSGKTTTLYATLKLLNKQTSNILTIEDPIEYTLEGINQVQLKSDIGLDFPTALRTFLRQDPDIIMVGEIRDAETAQIAIRAALTGHLVLSTIHTNSAWGIVSRLLDMGVPPYLIASTLNAAVAQRLVRKLCNSCKKEEKFDTSRLTGIYEPDSIPETHHVPVGCDQCLYTGYQGRIAIYEILPINQELANMIKENKSIDLANYLKNNELALLFENAYKLFVNGTTSLEEITPILINQ